MIKTIHIKLLLLFSLSILFGHTAFTQNITDPVPVEQHVCVGADVNYTVFGFIGSTIKWHIETNYLSGEDVLVPDNASNVSHNGFDYNTGTLNYTWDGVTYTAGGFYMLQIEEVAEAPSVCSTGLLSPGLKVNVHAIPTISSVTPTDFECSGDKGSLAVVVSATVPTPLQLQYRLVTSADVEVVAWLNDNLTHSFINLDAGGYKVQIRYVLVSDNSKIVKGSYSESSVAIIVEDDITNPTASNPAGIAVQCIGDVPAADITVVIDEADNCSTPTVAFVSDSDNGGLGTTVSPYVVTRTYSVTDAAGNSINVVQLITAIDDTAPIISSCPTNLVECAANEVTQKAVVSNIELNPLNYSDNCGGVLTVQYQIKDKDNTILVDFGDDADGDASGYDFPEGLNTITYRVIDVAGLSSDCSFTITVKHKPGLSNIE